MSSKSTAEMLQDLIDSKYDMKSAIEEYGLYGVTVEGGLVTYDEAIKNISSKILTSEKETIICEPGLAFQTNIVVPLKVDLRNLTSANYLFHKNMFYDSGIDKAIMETIHIYSSESVTDMSWMFYACENLTTVPLFDTSNVTNMRGMFNNCTALTNVGGFKNLGMQESMTTDNMVSFSSFGKLTHDSLLNIINNLYDRASAGYSNLTLKFSATAFRLLTDEEKAIATNKGWILASI